MKQPYEVVILHCASLVRAQFIHLGQVKDDIELAKRAAVASEPDETGKLAEITLAGGACTTHGKPIMQNIIVHAKWGKRKQIRFGQGILNAWLPEERTGKFKKLDASSKLLCKADEP